MIRFLALLAALLLGGPAAAQGTLPVALSQQVDANGHPLAGALLYVYVVGTVATPQNAFQDAALTSPLPWPVQADQNGRLPMFYLASGSVHVRLTDSTGNVQFDYPQMLVIGASGGGGGGATIDPTSIATTGDIKFRMTAEALSGWVTLNGQTIGSALSGATGRANADTQSLFLYLWSLCANATANRHCPVVGGLGGSGLADFNANKQLTLPDMRDRLLVGRDCMGSACAGGLLAANVTSAGDGVDSPLGTGGLANQTVAQANLPNVAFANSGITVGSTLVAQAAQGCSITSGTCNNLAFGSVLAFATTGASGVFTLTNSATFPWSITSSVSSQGSAASGGSGTALDVMNPFALGTWYCKL